MRQQLGQDTAPGMRQALISAESNKSQSLRRAVHVAGSGWPRGYTNIWASAPWLGQNKDTEGRGATSRERQRVRQFWGLLSFCFYKPRRSLKFSSYFFYWVPPVMRQGHRFDGTRHGTPHAACVSKGSGGLTDPMRFYLDEPPPVYCDYCVVKVQSVGLHVAFSACRWSPVHLLPAPFSSLWVRQSSVSPIALESDGRPIFRMPRDGPQMTEGFIAWPR